MMFASDEIFLSTLNDQFLAAVDLNFKQKFLSWDLVGTFQLIPQSHKYSITVEDDIKN